MSDAGYSEKLTFRETKAVLRIIARLAKKDGQQVGAFIRTGLRTYLRTRPDLTEESKAALGQTSAPSQLTKSR